MPGIISEAIINYSSLIAIKGARLLLVVIDTSGQPDGEAKKTIARLHWTAETKLGVPLICTTLDSLRAKMLGAISITEYIPNDLYAKIDCMLGYTKIERHGFRDALGDDNLIVLGAHLAHTSNSKSHSPSIAALVASKNASGLQHAGTVRIQRATEADARRPSLKIERFIDMMLELFKEWEHQDVPPSRMIFFRDSVDFDNTITRAEFRQIHQAHTKAFPRAQHKLEIACVVVNKNTALTYVYTDAPNDLEVTPVADYLATGDTNAKHRYHIAHSDMKNLSKETLADIVSPNPFHSSPFLTIYRQATSTPAPSSTPTTAPLKRFH